MNLKHLQHQQLNRVKYLNEIAEAYQKRVASKYLRKEYLDKQTMHNYKNEYDRIRAHLENSAIPYTTRQGLKNRATELKNMGARAVDSIN